MKMQNKTTLKYHFTPTKLAKMVSFTIVWWNDNNHLFSMMNILTLPHWKIIHIHISYYPTTQLSIVKLEKLSHMCTRVYVLAWSWLFFLSEILESLYMQIRMAITKRRRRKKERTSVDKHVEKLESWWAAGRNVQQCSRCGKQCGISSKMKSRINTWSSNSMSGYIPKRIERRASNRYLYTCVHKSIILRIQRSKQSKCPSTNEWVNKIWYIHTMEYYSALKRRKFQHMLQYEWIFRTFF